MAYYLSPINAGLEKVRSMGDGYTISLQWWQAYAQVSTNRIAYHIYYSTQKECVFNEGVKYLSIDGNLCANITNLIPGQVYFFSVRAVEYNSNVYDLENLPIAYDNLRVYPSSVLRQNITDTSLVIPLVDVFGFPNTGIIKIGAELIEYFSIDNLSQDLYLSGIGDRGFNNTDPRFHTTDGYDGYDYWSPIISLFTLGENLASDRIFLCQNRFEYPNFAWTQEDGYKQVLKDLLNTDLSASDEANEDFPTQDHSGYRRKDLALLLNGECYNSYLGGQRGCIDAYGQSHIVRGFDLQDTNTQREEELLRITGRPAVLIERRHTGIVCSCYLASAETLNDRCVMCNGSKFVVGFQQYYNPRRSDGRIMVRVSPVDDAVKPYEAGLESEVMLDMWSLVIPTIHERDIIVLFDLDGNEEFRYEVGAITRNNTILGEYGAQKFRAIRVRKTDPIYQIRIFRDTSMFPTTINSGISSVPGKLMPHSHVLHKNEHDPSTWSQTTEVAAGHNHQIIIQGGFPVILEALGHTHTIII